MKRPVYRFDDGVLGQDDIDLNDTRLRIGPEGLEISLQLENPYRDMLKM